MPAWLALISCCWRGVTRALPLCYLTSTVVIPHQGSPYPPSQEIQLRLSCVTKARKGGSEREKGEICYCFGSYLHNPARPLLIVSDLDITLWVISDIITYTTMRWPFNQWTLVVIHSHTHRALYSWSCKVVAGVNTSCSPLTFSNYLLFFSWILSNSNTDLMTSHRVQALSCHFNNAFLFPVIQSICRFLTLSHTRYDSTYWPTTYTVPYYTGRLSSNPYNKKHFPLANFAVTNKL